jgi:hypothetical protein
MRLPTWFVKVAKPIYKRVQRVPVVGAVVQKMAHHVLSRKGFAMPRFVSGSVREQEVLAERLRQYSLIIQGVDQANRFLFQRLLDLESRVQREHKVAQDARERVEKVAQDARERVEFVRDEVMFELRKELQLSPPVGSGSVSGPAVVEPKLIKKGALEQRPLRLNIGCGHMPHQEYVNVDSRELPGVDLVADATALPIDSGTVDEIFASHLVEHFPLRYLKDVLLPYWYVMLVPGGILRLILPDAEGMLKAHAEGEMSFDDLALVMFGKQDYDGDFHFAMFTPDSIKQLLECVGFASVELIAQNRTNGLCREMELRAIRGEAA